MSNKRQELHSSLSDDFFDDLQAMSDDEVVSEAIEDFGSLESALGNIRFEIAQTINKVAKNELARARSLVLDERVRSASTTVDPLNARKLLDEFLLSEAGQSRLTLAARKGKSSSKKDLLGAFTDLCRLQNCSHSSPPIDFGRVPKAEFILKRLGVTEPSEIDVEAIAWHLGAVVKYDNLNDCEARIVGTDDAAIITVDIKSSPQRQRFSVCHELGHWIYHRRRMLMCHGDEIERPSPDLGNMERMADRFAAELLMPAYLFADVAQQLGRPSMSVVRKLSEIFNTSYTAAAIRLVETSNLPLVLACHGVSGRKWFARSCCLEAGWFPKGDLSSESSAFGMVFGKRPSSMSPKTVSAATWFGRRDASRWEVVEDSCRSSNGEVLTLLAFKNPHNFLLENT